MKVIIIETQGSLAAETRAWGCWTQASSSAFGRCCSVEMQASSPAFW